MSNISLLQIKDTIEHKKHVLDAGYKLAKYLLSSGKEELCISLLQRIAEHDNSKFSREELLNLSSIYKTTECFTNPSYSLSQNEKDNIQLHWQNNSHHPEHYQNIEEMSEIDITEMICDWYARSVQYKTDLLEFIETRQKQRFNFPEEIYNKIIFYTKILLNGCDE